MTLRGISWIVSKSKKNKPPQTTALSETNDKDMSASKYFPKWYDYEEGIVGYAWTTIDPADSFVPPEYLHPSNIIYIIVIGDDIYKFSKDVTNDSGINEYLGKLPHEEYRFFNKRRIIDLEENIQEAIDKIIEERINE